MLKLPKLLLINNTEVFMEKYLLTSYTYYNSVSCTNNLHSDFDSL